MKFAINNALTEMRIWMSEKIKPSQRAAAPAQPANNLSRPDVQALMKLIMMGNGLSSVVRSRTADRQNNWGVLSARNDVRQLARVFRIVEDLHTDQSLKAINESLTRDGIKKGFTFEFS